MALPLQEVNDVISHYTGLARKVLDYSVLIKSLVDEAKKSGFDESGWDPLKALIETEGFVRVGNFKEVMNWQEYVQFLTGWASTSLWDCSFKRVTEVGSTVFLELEERSEIGDFKSVVNSMSVYEFNAAGKIQHIDVYLQMELPPVEMLQSYEGVN